MLEFGKENISSGKEELSLRLYLFLRAFSPSEQKSPQYISPPLWCIHSRKSPWRERIRQLRVLSGFEQAEPCRVAAEPTADISGFQVPTILNGTKPNPEGDKAIM